MKDDTIKPIGYLRVMFSIMSLINFGIVATLCTALYFTLRNAKIEEWQHILVSFMGMVFWFVSIRYIQRLINSKLDNN